MAKGLRNARAAALVLLAVGAGFAVLRGGTSTSPPTERSAGAPVTPQRVQKLPIAPLDARVAAAPATIYGTVLRGEHEMPESGRVVTLLCGDDAPRQATTDALGRFAFDDVGAGASYEVRVEADDCAPVRRTDLVPFAGEWRDVGDLILDTPAQIIVEVTGPTGEPLAGAVVEVYRESSEASLAFRPGGAPPSPDAAATTDAAGRVTHVVSRDAVWSVVAHAPGLARRIRAGIWFPEGRSGARVGFTLPGAEVLSGRVLDDRGRPIGAAIVLVRPRPPISDTYHWTRDSSDAMWTRTTADASGRFTIGALPPGATDVLAAPPGGAPVFALAVVVPEIDDVDVPLPPTAALTGRVTDASSGAPLAGVAVVVRSGWPDTDVSTSTGADGRWEVSGVSTRRDVTATFRGPRGFFDVTRYVSSYGNSPLRSGETRTVDVALARGARVTGVATLDGQPAAGAEVRVVTFTPDFDLVRRIAYGHASADGRYEVDGVRPGPVAVYASAPGDDTDDSYSAWFSAIENGSDERARLVFEIASGESVARDVVASFQPDEDPAAMERMMSEMMEGYTGVTVRGRVTTADGVPLLHAEVVVDGIGLERVGDEVTRWPPVGFGWPVAADGTFERQEELDEEERTIVVYAYDSRHDLTVVETHDVPEGTTEMTVNVVLEERPLLSGRVVADGEPVAGASIYWDRAIVARTGADGTFAARVPTGSWKLGVAAPGCVRTSFEDVACPSDGVAMFELERSRALTGRVVDAAGQPVRGVLVRPVDEDGDTVVPYHRWWHSPPPPAGVTDEDGRFVLSEIGADTQALRLGSLSGHSSPIADMTTAPLDARATDVRIVAAPGCSIAGRVIGPDGKGVARVEIELTRGLTEDDDYDDRTWTCTTDQSGEFSETGLPAGIYDAEVNPRRRSELVPVFLEIAAGLTDLDVRLEAAAEISGVVVFPDGRPVPRSEVVLTRIDERPDGERPWERDMDDYTDETGAFRIVVPPRARFRADFAGHTRIADSALLRGGEDLSSATTELRLVAQTGLRIAGTIEDPDGTPIGRAEVDVRCTDGEVRRDRTDARGTFAVAGMEAPVRGALTIHADGFVPQQVKDIAAGTDDVRIVMQPGISISGRLRRADGSRVKDAFKLRALRTTDPSLDLWRTEIARDGTFDMQGLEPGTWEIQAIVTGCMTIEECVPLGTFKAGTTDLELQLPETTPER